MPVLSQSQIAQVARAGGLPGDPGVWAAIAMAESSGRTDVVNSIGCVGLWQINQPVHVKSHPTWTVKWLQNPVNNAKAAAVIYRGQGFSAWEAYTGPDGTGSDGPWRQYYKGSGGTGATAADWSWDDIIGDGDDFKRGYENPFGLGDWLEEWGMRPDYEEDFQSDPLGGIGDLAKGVGTIAEAVAKTAVWLGNAQNWVRIGYVVGGGLLVAMGLSIVAKPLLSATPAGQVAKKAGGAAKKAGAAVKSKVRSSSSE